MLRESVIYGLKFKENFEIVQKLLGMLETQLVGLKSLLSDVTAKVNATNMQLSQIFSEYPIIKRLNQPVWLPLEAVELSNNGKTFKNTTQKWFNLPFGTLVPISSGKWEWTYVINSANPSNTMEIGVCSDSEWKLICGGGSPLLIREKGYMFSWNNSVGFKFGNGSWEVKNGYRPDETINMLLDADSGVLTFTCNSVLLAKCTGIPKYVIPIASLAPVGYNVQVTLISASYQLIEYTKLE